MKKQLIVMAGLTAMFAACTNEDVLENFGTNEVAKTNGITFSVTGGVESRGDFKLNENGNFVPGWNAELDRISIVHYGVATGLLKDEINIGTWGNTTGAERKTGSGTLTPVTYKATKSGSKGVFTAANDADLLHFTKVGDKPRIASFRAFRGVSANVAYSTAESVETMTVDTPVATNQTQKSASKAPFDNFVMVSDTIGNICTLDYAVGESIDLSFEMPYTALVIKTTGYDKNVYGNLKSVQVELEDNVIANDNTTLDIAKKKDGKWAYTTTGSGSQTVTLTIVDANGAEWNDGYHAFMQVLPVKRTETEKYWVTLQFANGTIKVQKTSSKNWEANGFYTVNVDLTATADYLQSATTLTVIKALPELDSSDEFDGVAASSITKLVSGKVLTADELAVIKAKYTGVNEFVLANEGADLGTNLGNLKTNNVTSLTLTAAKTAPVITSYTGLVTIDCPEVTTIPDGAFKGNTASFTKLNFPKVQTIGKEAFSGATAITEISCATAGANKLTIGTTNAETGVKTSALATVGEKAFAGLTGLTIIDAPALTTMGNYAFGTNTSGCVIEKLLLPAYDWAASTDLMTSLYLLANNATLVEIDFSGTTTIAGTTVPKAGCTLEKVTLAANTNVGASAFAGQTNTAFAVANINKVASVADNAFNGSKLAGDIKFENTVAAIGAGAFAGTSITSFDFTGVTTIGEGAFQDVATLDMINVPSVEVLEASVFNDCSAITAAQFDAATTLKGDALNGLASGANVVFKKAITTFEGNPFGATFPAVTDDNKDIKTPCVASATVAYNLYVNATQEGVDGATLTYKSGDYYYKVIFNKIVK